MTEPSGDVPPRDLTPTERAALDFMLAGDDPRLERLREQARTAKVVWECTCGCATINVEVDKTSSSPVDFPRRDPISADGVGPNTRPDLSSLVVFVDDGWLSSLELVWYNEPIPEFPPADQFEPPGIVLADA